MADTQSEYRLPLVAIVATSCAACGFLFWLLYFREAQAVTNTWSFLPGLNALMNAGASVCLLVGWVAILRKKQKLHQKLMVSAFVFSSVFLAGYIVHHALHGDTKFAGEGWVRAVYLSILGSHVVMSIVVLPMVLTTFFLSLTGRFDQHRRIARWTFPLWLYVSVTGVLIFVMLKSF
ncbi:MAG: DUF420 domain-containing protein [Myxococcales bacterium]|nr:DUF420 domain-containing protein [Myxococcales bacterium]